MKLYLNLIYSTRRFQCAPILFFFSLLLFSCQSTSTQYGNNPPAAGFNQDGSDAQAIAIADEVMEAMGGRKNWDNARFFSWDFFNRRKHYWDKQTGNIRIETKQDSGIFLLNLHTMEGKVQFNGKNKPDQNQEELLKRAKGMWINDMYWLFMPFKLKDSGVTLKYLGEGNTTGEKVADVLQLTFENVGVTPQNKYYVYVDKETRLVSQWDYFKTIEQDTAQFQLPWKEYKAYGQLKLASSRGRNSIGAISVFENLPTEKFTEF